VFKLAVDVRIKAYFPYARKFREMLGNGMDHACRCYYGGTVHETGLVDAIGSPYVWQKGDESSAISCA
jgi:hypothetical protein